MKYRLLHIPTARYHYNPNLAENTFLEYINSLEWISPYKGSLDLFQFGGRSIEGSCKFSEYEFMWVEVEDEN